MIVYLPVITFLLSLAASLILWVRYTRKHEVHELLWAIGMAFYGIAELCVFLFNLNGWNPLVFRVWYLLGAILVAAWLGQGSVALFAPRRVDRVLFWLLLAGSAYAAVRTFLTPLDPGLVQGVGAHTANGMNGRAFVDGSVRMLTPLFNGYGSLALLGGAVYSLVLVRRKQLPGRTGLGSMLVFIGTVLPAFSGSLQQMGLANALLLSEFLGGLLLALGLILAEYPGK